MQDPMIFLASDVHLGVASKDTERAFLRWLEFCGTRASRVVINGDLFDFWFEYGRVIPRGHTRVLGALASLVDAGIPVLMMGGNHDWWGGDFLTEEIGLDFFQKPTVLDLNGRRTLLAHGDGLGAGDLGYRALKLILRGSLTRLAFRWMHPDLGAWIARKVSKTGLHPQGPSPKQLARSKYLEAWAIQKLSSEPDLDLVVLGHTHVPVLVEVAPGRFYLNAGDWLQNRSYGVVGRRGPPRLFQWSDGEPSELEG